MSYDIYGNNLRRGYCEVHPSVHQEYPCDLCYAESSKKEREKELYLIRIHEQEQARIEHEREQSEPYSPSPDFWKRLENHVKSHGYKPSSERDYNYILETCEKMMK